MLFRQLEHLNPLVPTNLLLALRLFQAIHPTFLLPERFSRGKRTTKGNALEHPERLESAPT